MVSLFQAEVYLVVLKLRSVVDPQVIWNDSGKKFFTRKHNSKTLRKLISISQSVVIQFLKMLGAFTIGKLEPTGKIRLCVISQGYLTPWTCELDFHWVVNILQTSSSM